MEKRGQRCNTSVSQALIMLVQLVRRRRRRVRIKGGWMEGEGKQWTVRLIAAALHLNNRNMMGPSTVGHRACSCQTSAVHIFHTPSSWEPHTQSYTQIRLHMLNHQKATKCFLTAEPSGTNTNKDFNSTEFTGQWKQQHFEFATVYIRPYLTHIMTLSKGKLTHFTINNIK